MFNSQNSGVHNSTLAAPETLTPPRHVTSAVAVTLFHCQLALHPR